MNASRLQLVRRTLAAMLCIGAVVLSVVSHRRCPVGGTLLHSEYFLGASVRLGTVHLGVMQKSPIREDHAIFAGAWTDPEVIESYLSVARGQSQWHLGGESAGIYRYTATNSTLPDTVKVFYLFSFPAWVVLLLLAYPNLRWLYHRRRGARRKREGLCVACGYDLHGIGSEKCPECGSARSAQQSA